MNPLVKAIPVSQNFRFLVIRPLTKYFIYNPMMLLAKVAYDVFFSRWRSSVRLSLKEIMSLIDSSSEFAWRKKLWFEIGKAQVNNTLKNCTNDCLLPFLKGCVKEGFAKDTLDILDQGNHVLERTKLN